MKDFLYKKSGFTLIEIVVAVVISSLVILGLTTLLLKLNQDIFDIQTQTSIYSDFSKFQSDFNNYKLKYPKSLNIVDNGNGYDVLLLTNSGSERGVLVGIVDITHDSDNYLHLDPVSNYDTYGEKVLGIKELSSTQTKNILTNSGVSYTMQFYDTNLYKNMKVNSFVLNSFNSGSILDVTMDLNTDFSPSFIGEDRDSSIDSTKLFRINFSLAKDTNIQLSSYLATGSLVSEPSWTMTGGGDCSVVDNAVGTNLDIATCFDSRPYIHFDTGATSTGVYTLIKIQNNWWFNNNLSYPIQNISKFVGSGLFGSPDVGAYSCPGNYSNTIVNCEYVNTLGYFYQWSAAMSGSVSTNNTGSRVQGVCPPGWAIPTKEDFTSSSNFFWPANDNDWNGNVTGWNISYAGFRQGGAGNGLFANMTTGEYFWSSYQTGGIVWREEFANRAPIHTSARTGDYPRQFFSVRCIKN